MISGDAAARAYDSTTKTYLNYRPISDRVSWACLSNTPSRETYNITNTDCYAGLRAQLHFQTCWDGVNLYKSDQSHVAYMSEIDNGYCPPTHPVQFIHIFLETSYMVNTIPGRVPGGRLVLSTGDTTGYSFHGDFQNGWNLTTLGDAIKQCSGPDSSGDINECEPLMRSYIRNAPQKCPMKKSTVDEQVTGLLDKLPGCFNILSGPARAQPSDMNCPPSVPRPAIIPTPDSTPLVMKLPTRGQQYGRPGWEYTGCSNDTQYGKRVLNGRMTSATNMTVETCQDFCKGLGYKYAGLEISNECYCDNYLLNNPVISTGTLNQGMCYWQCSGDKLQYCGGQARIDIYNNTAMNPLPMPSIQRASGTYGYKGCYVELNQARALANGSLAADTMTPDVCRKYCLGKGMKWFGVEYGREVSLYFPCELRINTNKCASAIVVIVSIRQRTRPWTRTAARHAKATLVKYKHSAVLQAGLTFIIPQHCKNSVMDRWKDRRWCSKAFRLILYSSMYCGQDIFSLDAQAVFPFLLAQNTFLPFGKILHDDFFRSQSRAL